MKCHKKIVSNNPKHLFNSTSHQSKIGKLSRFKACMSSSCCGQLFSSGSTHTFGNCRTAASSRTQSVVFDVGRRGKRGQSLKYCRSASTSNLTNFQNR